MLDRLHTEHGQLRTLSRELELAPDNGTISKFAALLRDHLDWERDELLPAVADSMGVSLA